jgi:hypothetical protein
VAADNGGFNTSIPVFEKDSCKVARKYPSGMKVKLAVANSDT